MVWTFALPQGCLWVARLAQSVEHQTFNLRVMGSSPISGDVAFYNFSRLCFDFFLPHKWLMYHMDHAKAGVYCMTAINRLVFINLFIYEAVFQQSFEKLDFKLDFPFGESKT